MFIYKSLNPWLTHPWMVRRGGENDGAIVARCLTFEDAKQWVLEWEGEVDDLSEDESLLVSVGQ